MRHASEAAASAITPKERSIIALDVPTAEAAREIVAELRDEVGAFKIGLQLFTAAGPSFVRELTSAGVKIFLDLKFHDIPNTVAMASVEAARLGVWMFNVHAGGGGEMMRRTVDEVRSVCKGAGVPVPKMIAVTVLTSSDRATLFETGVGDEVADQVARLARLAADSGMDGVVASSFEVATIRDVVSSEGFLIVTPGIRPIAATSDDQKRVTTFARAIASGSDYVVIGRPVTQAVDRREAVRQMLAETDQTLNGH